MDADLEKRISDSVEDGSEPPPSDLASVLSEDPEAASLFRDLQVLEGRLRSWSFEVPPREYWRNFVPRMTSRLGTLQDTDVDVVAPPAPDDEPPEPDADEAPADAADPLAALAGLVGRSMLPPAKAFEEKAGGGAEERDDAVIDIGKLRESAAPPPSEDEEAAAPPAARPLGSGPSRPSAEAVPLAPRAEEPRSHLSLYVIGLLVVALAVVGYFALGDGGQEETTLASTERRVLSSDDPPRAPAPATPSAAVGVGDRGSERRASGEPDPEGTGPGEAVGGEAAGLEAPGGEAVDDPAAGASRRLGRPARPGAATVAGGSVAAPAAASPEPAAAPTKALVEAPGSSSSTAPIKSGSASLDDLLSGATTASGPEKRASSDVVSSAVGEGAGGEEVPDQPSRSQVRRAMGSIAGQVAACRSMVESTVRVNATVTVASSGAVTSVSAAGGPEGVNSCVERAARGARFPAFRQPTFTVTYPFVLSPPEE